MKKVTIASMLAFLSFAAVNGQDENQALPQGVKKEEVQEINQKFNKLFKQQLAFKDPEARALAKQAEENNKELKIDFAIMKDLVEKWSAAGTAGEQ